MSRVVFSAWLVRQPVPGILSWGIHWMAALQRLGHEVWYLEESGYPHACFDPEAGAMGDDCTVGMSRCKAALELIGLEERLCFVDQSGAFHGMGRKEAEVALRDADLLIEIAPLVDFGDAARVADLCRHRVMVDGEPALTQIRAEQALERGLPLREYERYFTHGLNLGSDASPIPTLGRRWTPLLTPVVPEMLRGHDRVTKPALTTVMNWQSHKPLEWRGRTYGQKDVEFERFMALPGMTEVPLEVAVSGKYTPFDRLREAGWSVRDAYELGGRVEDYWSYIGSSFGEFSVTKNIFVATWSGFFPDRTTVYLACGRPAVLQDTGFSEHIPCGRGLFAVRDPESAAEALEVLRGDYEAHREWARELAAEYFGPRQTVGRVVEEAGG